MSNRRSAGLPARAASIAQACYLLLPVGAGFGFADAGGLAEFAFGLAPLSAGVGRGAAAHAAVRREALRDFGRFDGEVFGHLDVRALHDLVNEVLGLLLNYRVARCLAPRLRRLEGILTRRARLNQNRSE